MIDFDAMPDGASDDTIAHYLKMFIQEGEDLVREKGILFALKKLLAISEQEMIGEYALEDIKAISNFIRCILDFNDPDSMDFILTIVIHMHLTSIWRQITQQDSITNNNVKALIDDAIEENNKYLYFQLDE